VIGGPIAVPLELLPDARSGVRLSLHSVGCGDDTGCVLTRTRCRLKKPSDLLVIPLGRDDDRTHLEKHPLNEEDGQSTVDRPPVQTTGQTLHRQRLWHQEHRGRRCARDRRGRWSRVAARIPGVAIIGATHDAAGLNDTFDGERDELLLDPRTAALLAKTNAVVKPPLAYQVKPGTVQTGSTYLAAGTSSTSANDRTGPTAAHPRPCCARTSTGSEVSRPYGITHLQATSAARLKCLVV
jgi:hypothetical protein